MIKTYLQMFENSLVPEPTRGSASEAPEEAKAAEAKAAGKTRPTCKGPLASKPACKSSCQASSFKTSKSGSSIEASETRQPGAFCHVSKCDEVCPKDQL